MRPLAQLVAGQLARYPDPAVERVVFGSADALGIAEGIDRWCVAHLGGAIRDAWMWHVSVGCVAGVTLDDGREVVVKTYAPDRRRDRLADVVAAQSYAADRGVAAARPLAGPHPLGLGHAVAEEARDLGRRPVLYVEPDRAAAAAGWVQLCTAMRGSATLLGAPVERSALYPKPHSPLFDFEATAGGAEWIDELARAARAVTDGLDAPNIVVHADWRGDNLRVDEAGSEVVAIYDWDSLRVDREAVALGEVAAMHSIDWSGPGDPYFATSDECLAFAEAVERARPGSFTVGEWRALRASIAYGWCYTARCEHARAMVGDDKPQFGMRARLRAEGASLLA